MNHNPLISIIIPSRNRGKLLKVCLDGIWKQTFSDYEVLIFDDGSEQSYREESQKLIEQYDHRFKLHFIHCAGVKGSGASFVRNQGIAIAQGVYIAFCDDDDYWCESNYLEKAARYLQSEQADVFFSAIEVRNTENQVVISKMMSNVDSALTPEREIGADSVYRLQREEILTYPDYAHLNITIASRALIERIGGFWEYTPYAEDVGFFIQLCDKAEKILFRRDICAVHNAPEQREQASVSNRMSLQDKRLLEISVYQRLLVNCESYAALEYTKKSLANTLKMLTHESQQKQPALAISTLARMAWGAYSTFKWGVYALWLSLKR